MSWTPERVKALRACLNLTQGEFAERFGITTRAVQSWEQPEDTSRYRQPSGLAMTILAQLDFECRQKKRRMGETT